MIPNGAMRVLGVGCANGNLGAAVKARNAGTYYVGIELYEAADKRAAKRLDKVFVSDVERFDWSRLAGNRFDCIVFADVLEHLVNPGDVLRSAISLLAPDGNVVCCLPNACHWSIISGLICGDWSYTETGVLDRTHLRFFTLKSFKKLLNDCGMETVDESRWVNDFDLHESMIPFLQYLKVDPRAFKKRSSSIQFVVRARWIKKNPVASSAIPNREKTIESTDWKKAKKTMAVVTCATDTLKVTEDFLASIAESQSGEFATQVIVVDDATTNGTAELLRSVADKYPWFHAVRNDNPTGVTKARNRGAGITDAKILVFLDGNSIVPRGTLEKMAEFLDDERVGIVGPQLLHPNGTVSHPGIVFTPDARAVHLYCGLRADDPKITQPKELPALTSACLMIKRKLFEDLNGFSLEDPVFYSDLDLCFKAREKGLLVVYQAEAKVIHAEGGNVAGLILTEEEYRISRMLFIGKWKDLMLKEMKSDPAFYLSGRDFRPAGR